ncbi:hypothetical protein D3C76_1778280 [compost metagenome]
MSFGLEQGLPNTKFVCCPINKSGKDLANETACSAASIFTINVVEDTTPSLYPLITP